jgi:exodeoxyribonuclease VII small subunit
MTGTPEHAGLEQSANDDVKAMSFEQALEALERIVDDLERGDVPLDQSIRIYERGEALKAHCDRLLKAAEDKVEKIRLSREGQPVGTEPLDGE